MVMPSEDAILPEDIRFEDDMLLALKIEGNAVSQETQKLEKVRNWILS